MPTTPILPRPTSRICAAPIRLYLAACLLVALAGCGPDEPPRSPADGTFTWTPTPLPALGVALDVPSVYELAQRGTSVFFRHDGTPLRLDLLTDEEAEGRGLWTIGAPGEAVSVGGREGRLHAYEHCDVGACARMLAYVFPHRGRSLGLQFRTDAATLDPVQAHILASLRFDA